MKIIFIKRGKYRCVGLHNLYVIIVSLSSISTIEGYLMPNFIFTYLWNIYDLLKYLVDIFDFANT